MITELLVSREKETADATLGRFYWGNTYFYRTCEPLQRAVKIMDQTAIPEGRYQILMQFSPHFGKDMPHLQNVPDFSDIMIHNGNTVADTHACILIGLTPYVDGVGSSVAALNDFMPRLEQALLNGEVYVTIKSTFPITH
jgi:hypothetical protein